MNNQEQQLIDEIRTLFNELIEEGKERFNITTKRIIYPSNSVYVSKAKKLYQKALELENINSKYSTYALKGVMNYEVGMVERYEYKYEKNSSIPKSKSITEIQNLMRNSTFHIKLHFCEVLGNIQIE